MPEAPEMEVVKDFLAQNLVGNEVLEARVLKPSVLRSLQGNIQQDLVGRVFTDSSRRGKFLILTLSGDRVIAINPKLTGGLQYCRPKQRVLKRTCILLNLSGGSHLRYTDDRQMGVFYYVSNDQLEDVPGLGDQGPDVLDDIGLEDFKSRLKGFHGEIKGILTRGRVLSGIGNAYADEILFDAKVYPFKRRKQLSSDELRRIHHSSRQVIVDATSVVRERMNGQLDHKMRDFLAVHNKGGQECPDCGNKISQITANKRITSYCRRCQPGMLIKN
ncbi:MAG: DNA-formamidopyrimidine glycosylase family protein [SAR202 cluster bacterium]|nr:DNA-formamidopyrimidine glycosylase family protein [SAR202 cluster bacterium]MDP6514580.1 DNA-formamidopyrimidine glycosylase family protein [SAR202 cluster bacterium]MDP6716268.1 DNA-formamidopyrimidine glycosylase family protein [SAR202 cluster bacterium]